MSGKIWVDLVGTGRSGQATKKNNSLEVDSNGDGIVHVSYKIMGFWNQDCPLGQEGYSIFDIPQASFTTLVGFPMLVREGLFVDLPSNTVFEKMEVKIVAQKKLSGEYNFLPVPINMMEIEEMSFNQNKDFSFSCDPYPKSVAEYIDILDVLDTTCVYIHVHPFQYYPNSQKVVALTEIEISIYFNHINSTVETQ